MRIFNGGNSGYLKLWTITCLIGLNSNIRRVFETPLKANKDNVSVTKFITYVQTYVQQVSLKWFCHKYKLDFFFFFNFQRTYNTGTVA